MDRGYEDGCGGDTVSEHVARGYWSMRSLHWIDALRSSSPNVVVFAKRGRLPLAHELEGENGRPWRASQSNHGLTVDPIQSSTILRCLLEVMQLQD